MQRQPPPVIVMNYHLVSDDPADPWQLRVSQEQFKRQIEHLASHRRFISVTDLERYLRGQSIPTPSVLLTFDDGYANLLEISNYLLDLGIRPLVFVLSNPEAADRRELGSHRELLKMSEVRRLARDGWDIGCHSATHRNFEVLDQSGIEKEVIGSKAALETGLGREVRYFASPRGVHNKAIVDAARRAGYDLAFTAENTEIKLYTCPLRIPRITVDLSHSSTEFEVIASPSVIAIRGLIARTSIARYC
jgi:peptidoglycan/xylan/chitin deacetylase (PgdA/CDA1 family)